MQYFAFYELIGYKFIATGRSRINSSKKNSAAIRRIIGYITPEEDDEDVWGVDQ